MDPLRPSAIDPLIDELRNRVSERRKSGFYPEGLEEDLDAHFRRIVSHRRTADMTSLRSSLDALEGRGTFSADRIQLAASAVPGGEQVHRVVGKMVARQTHGILEQVQQFSDVVRDALGKIADALEDPYGHQHGDLVGQLDAIWERLAAWERGPVDSAAAVGDLRRRVEALEAAEQARRFTPTFTANAFESEFRGSSEELKLRYRELALHFAGQSPVVDVGCGRGEFIEVLHGLGVDARGVEIDSRLVEEGIEQGLDITRGDGVTHIASLPDRSLGGIALIQVVEHLTPQQVVDLVATARHKLREDGLMIVETVNPQSLYTFAHSFYLDPTHANPVHPAYLKFLFEQSGWSRVEIEWRSPPPSDDVLRVDDSMDEVTAANVERLNQLLFAPQDYALMARR
ncbi:MAG: class I SAM-dependent methyltransferase [Acidimicrobiales bacterium]